MSQENLSNKFITIYNEMDAFFRRELDVDETISHRDLIWKISKDNQLLENNKYDLLTFARLRNAIVHNPRRADAHPIAEPHEYIVAQYEMIRDQLLNPVKALSIAIPFNKIFTTLLEDKAINVMREMNENTFTHVPVMEGDKMVGVFSENVVFSFLVKHEIAIVDKDITISEFGEFLPIEKHPSEYFLFASRTALLFDIQKLFDNELEKNRRLGVVFITDSGKQDEKLLGMITAWDIAGK